MIIVLKSIIMPFGAHIAGRLRARTTLLIASVFAIASVGLASFVPRSGFGLFAFLLTVGLGICIGLSYTTPIDLGWRAMPEKSGLVSGLIIAGFGLGSLVYTYFGSKIINPDNLGLVTVSDGVSTWEVFPDEVALRVPIFLGWLTVSYITLTCISQLLIVFDK